MSEAVVLVAVEDRQVTDRNIRGGNNRVEQPKESAREHFDRVLVEQIFRIDETGRKAGSVGLLVQSERQVELGGVDLEIDGRDLQPGQRERTRRKILERDRHLEQGMTRRRPLGFEQIHEPLERNVGMGERRQIHFADGSEHLVETERTIHLGPQHQRIDEHADDIIEGGVATTGYRSTHRNIIGVRHARQKHCKCGMDHHEQSGSGRTRNGGETGMDVAVDVELKTPARVGLNRGTLPIDRQRQFGGQVRKRTTPVLRLPRDQARRIRLRTQNRTLPQRVIDVLHR